MQYRQIRRKDRVWDGASAERLLETAEYGFLALSDGGAGYGVPISFVKSGAKIYFHCAPEGRKLDAIGAGAEASFCAVGKTRVIPGKFTTAYESAMAQGRISLCVCEEERLEALRLLVKKYSPDFEEVAEKYIAASKSRTAVLRLDIRHISGKAKLME